MKAITQIKKLKQKKTTLKGKKMALGNTGILMEIKHKKPFLNLTNQIVFGQVGMKAGN